MKNVGLLIRLEWLAAAVTTLLLYQQTGASWWLFAALILAPDLSMLGYLAGPRLGALAYNALHNLIAPLLLGLVGVAATLPLAVSVALVWIAHIAIDRALGYGLKLSTGFHDTHLGRIGRGGPNP